MNNMRHRRRKFFLFPLMIGALFLFTWIIMLLWNGVLVPAVAGIHVIGYFQAMGILVLSKILFGFGGGWSGRKRHWRSEMSKWNNMSQEEREQWKEDWRNRCRKFGFDTGKFEKRHSGEAGAE